METVFLFFNGPQLFIKELLAEILQEHVAVFESQLYFKITDTLRKSLLLLIRAIYYFYYHYNDYYF